MKKPKRKVALQIVEFGAKKFAKALPKDTVYSLQGVHDKKQCYFVWLNGELKAIVYDPAVLAYLPKHFF